MCKTAPVSGGRAFWHKEAVQTHTNNVHSVVMMLFYIVHTDRYTHTVFFKLSVEDWGYRS